MCWRVESKPDTHRRPGISGQTIDNRIRDVMAELSLVLNAPIPSLRHPTGVYSHYWLAGIEEIVENTVHLRAEYAECLKDEDFTVFGPVRNHDRFVVFTVTENADWLVLDMDPDIPNNLVSETKPLWRLGEPALEGFA
ncbi:MAG: hypothetical protein U0941_13220 [Planctomycetaceae bacterium]